MRASVLLLFAAIFLYGCGLKSSVEQKNNLTILHLTGNHYDQGFAHGKLLKKDINDIIERWKKEVEQQYQMPFAKATKLFFSTTDIVESINNCCPELIEEIRGISDGSEIDYNTILSFQLSEEIDVLYDITKANRCTSISINRTDSTPTLLAQNMDPPKFLHGKPVLLHFINSKTNDQSYVFTFPGFIGLTGLNSNGVGITCNGMSMLNRSKDGLPVSFVVRKVLQCENEYDAFNFLHQNPVAIPQCFTVGGKTEARCYECSPNMMVIFKPIPIKNLSLHTNFSALNNDFNSAYIKLLSDYGKTVLDPYFCPRYFHAYDMIVDYNYNLSKANIINILSSTEPEIEPISNENTYGCLVMELSSFPTLYIAPGKPSTTPFIKLSFNYNDK